MLTDANFEHTESFAKSEAAGLFVIFYAPWCGHSKRIMPHFERAAHRLTVARLSSSSEVSVTPVMARLDASLQTATAKRLKVIGAAPYAAPPTTAPHAWGGSTAASQRVFVCVLRGGWVVQLTVRWARACASHANRCGTTRQSSGCGQTRAYMLHMQQPHVPATVPPQPRLATAMLASRARALRHMMPCYANALSAVGCLASR